MSDKKTNNKYCVVPDCCNTSRTAPEKLFVSVPFDPSTRKVWQKAMRRAVFVSDKSHVYCCEDHFDVKEDIENYMYITTMKKGNIRLKPNVVPRFFDCQKDNKKIENEDVEQKNGKEIKPKSKEKGVQVSFKAKVCDKGVQCTSKDMPLLKMEKKRKCPFKEKTTSKEIRLEKNSTTSVSSSDSTSTFLSSQENL